MSNPLKALQEKDIRPTNDASQAEQKRRYESDVARMLARRSEFVEVACPACGSEERRPRFEKLTLTYPECVACGTVYVSPRPPPDVLREYYEKSENYAYWNAVIFPQSEAVRRERIFRPRVERLVELCKRNGVGQGALVEVGSGFGTFCEELQATGAFRRVLAVEPTPDLAETCRKRGVEVIEKRIEDVRIDEPIDVVASFEVIEHLFEPATFIEACRQMLRPNGLVVLTCPNVRGFDVDVLGTASPAVDAEHLNYFHPASLGLLLERHGFAVVESQTPGRLDVDIVRNRVIAGDVEVTDRFLRRILLDDFERVGASFQDFLVANGMSSNMWIAARKVS